MAYVPVPKDLTKVKTKVALNLTKRQLIFFSLAAVVGIPFYLIMRKPIGSSIAAILMVTIMLPFFFMAMYEKDGLPFEKVVGSVISDKAAADFLFTCRSCWNSVLSVHEKTNRFQYRSHPDGNDHASIFLHGNV